MRNPFTHTHSCVCPCMWQWLCSMITLPLCDNMSFIFSLWSVGGGYDMGFVITLLLFLYYPGNWQDNCAALVLGGGYDKGFVQSLGQDGADMIRSFVLQGGAYIGICAGAYFACDHIEFEKGSNLEVCGDRPLKFYPGTGHSH